VDIERLVLFKEHATRPAELEPLIGQLAVLIEDLAAIVLRLGHEQPSARLHRERVGNVDLARLRAFLAPRLDELAVAGELDDARVGAPAVSVGHEDIAVGRDENRGGRVEFVRTVAGDTRLAEPQQNFAVRTELYDLMTLPVLAAAIGDPHVPWS